MKIDPTTTPRAAAGRSTGKPRSSQGSGFADSLSAGERAKSVQASSGVSSIDALVALQGVDERQTSEDEALDHGKGLLDCLDELRLGLLSGRIGIGQLENLREMLRRQVSQQASGLDSRLMDLLAEIETRAAVELAKLGR